MSARPSPLLLLCSILASSAADEHVSVRVGSLAPQHTAAGQPRPLHVSWPLLALDGEADPASLAPLRQTGAELVVVDDLSGAELLLAARDDLAEAGGGTLTLQPAELARLPRSRALSYRVRARLSDGAWTPLSAPAPWRVGPGPRLADWPAGAHWVCTSPSGSADLRSSVLRAEFALPAGRAAASAQLHVTGLGQFRVAVNGQDLLGDEFNAPGQTDWRKTVLYSTYDVPAALLVPAAGGKNAIAASLSNGMYNVPGPGSRYTKCT